MAAAFLLVLVIVCACVAGLVALIQYAKNQEKARNAALVEVTRGQIRPNLRWTNRAEFEVEGVRAALLCDPGSSDDPGWTRLEFNFNSGGRLRVRPQGFFMNLRRMFGAEDIEIGDPKFDPEYQIEATPPAFARSVLTREAKAAIVAISRNDFSLDIGYGTVMVEIRRCLPPHVGELRAFFTDGLRLFAAICAACPQGVALKKARPVGIEFMEVKSERGHCPTCATSLDDQSVKCTKCGTQQHWDCWKYVGSCATFACGSTKFRQVRA